MYHHRYQPPTNLANKTAAFASSHNYTNNSYPSSSSATSVTSNSATKSLSSNNPRIHPASKQTNSIHAATAAFNHSGQHQAPSSYSYAPTTRSAEDRQDVIFRKVRGILNKITPETFDKLSKELVNVGLDSPRTLRGVIYLLFDKALKDLKYSSLYAKLCQELSEKAPNFEVDLGPNTFCKFLISKCEDEFERRRRATEDFDRKNDLTDEEFEQRAIAKQKMLGNIKFICELGKKRLLQEEILHECIRGLLSKKKERSIQDQAQDLECLCQIMRTIGSLLDIQASRNLMNQYFERIDLFSKKPELPSRIRFMLRDVIDLRNNNWRPRPFQREDNVPQPLSKLREEAGYDPNISSSIDKFGNNRNLIGMSDLSKLHGNKMSLLLDDEPSFTTSSDFHWGPSFLSLDHPFDPFSMGVTTNKPAQKSSAASADPLSVAKPEQSTQFVEKPSNFRVHDPFPKHGLERKLDCRPAPTRPNIVNKQQSTNDFGRFGDGLPKEVRQRPDVLNARGDMDPLPGQAPLKVRQPGFGVYNPRMIQHDRPVSYDDARYPIEPRFVQQPTRGLNVQQPNRPIHRLTDPGDSSHSPMLDGHHPPPLPQNRLSNRNIEARNPLPVHNESRGLRDRRSFHQDRCPEQNSRFTNKYRPPRSERAPRGRENFQFERSSNESETNQNWRAGPPSSASSVTSKHSSNPPLNIDGPVSQRPTSRFNETELQNGQTSERSRNSGPQPEPKNASLVRTLSKHSQDQDKEGPSVARDDAVAPLKRYTDKDERSFQKLHEPRADYTHRTLSRNVDSNRAPQSERPFNISPPKPRNYDPSSRHNVMAQQNSVPDAHTNVRQNPKPIQVDGSETLDPSRPSSFNQPHRKTIPTPAGDATRNQSIGKNANSNDSGAPNVDRRSKPLSRSNNPSIGSDMQDSDRVSSWRKASGFNPAPQQTAKTPPKETVKPQLTASILPKPLTKISDTNFSLRPSHNLVSARTTLGMSKPIAVTEDSSSSSNNVVQVISEASKESARDQQGFPVPNPDGAEKPETNGSPSSKDTHNKSARDFHVNKFIYAVSERSDGQNCNISRIVSKVKELKIPKSYQPDCLVSAIRQSIFKTESDRDSTKKLLNQLLTNTFEPAALLSAFKIIFEQLQALEAEIPKVKSLVAGFLSQSILDGSLTLEEVGGVLSGGRHHPLFLLCLQKLDSSAGQAWLCEKFVNSKIDLMSMLPEVDRSKDRLASVLKDRCLGFLDPMLTIEPDLWEQMKDKDSSPTAIYRWIKDNVSPTIQCSPTFAHVLVTCLVRYIHNNPTEEVKSPESSEGKGEETPQSDKSSPSSSSQGTADIEKEQLPKYQQMLRAILKDKQMQLATLYSLQSFYHGLDFPKGALLRWFNQMYALNIVDDDIFFTWKEEINDKFPGKGQALFQVNTWLNWLAEAESEEEDEV